MEVLRDLPSAFWVFFLFLAWVILWRALKRPAASSARHIVKSNRLRPEVRVPPPDLSDSLLNACLGDKAKAERLTAYELRLSPGISRKMARERAFQRILRENR